MKTQPQQQNNMTNGLSVRIGAKLKSIRQEKGISTVKMVDDLKISRTTLFNIEAGTANTTINMLEDLINYLGFTPEELFKNI